MCKQNLLTISVVLFLGTATLRAQSVDTGIRGIVADSSGAVIANAQVTITAPATGQVRTVETGVNGSYEVRYLLPGVYDIEAQLSGFRTERTPGVRIQIGQMARIDFTLQVGEVTERVEVSAQGVLLETQSGVIGDVVTPERIVNLPLNGRNYIHLGNLTPGVIANASATSGNFRANGSRSNYQQVAFNGVTAINNRGNNTFMFPSVDAVQEFKVQSGGYSAEYGGHAGANVQLQLRSGTNGFHGTLFEFVRNDVWDARGFFRPAPLEKPRLRRNQFGGVGSGPIVRDKTFFMGSYEGVRERRQTAGNTNFVPQAMREGNFGTTNITDPFTNARFENNVIPASRLNPVARNIINTYMPLPNLAGTQYAGVSRNLITQDQIIGRVDHNFGPKDQVFGHYLYHGGNYPSVAINPNFGTEHYLRNQSVGFQYLRTFSATKLNEFRFGYMRGSKERLSPRRASGFTAERDLGITGLKIGGPNGRPLHEFENGFPQVNIQGFQGMGDSTGGEAIDNSRTFQFVDNFSLIKGAHGLKWGVDFRRLSGDANTTNVPFGQLAFTRDIAGHAAASYMLGLPKTMQTPEGVLLSGVRQWRYGFYFQNDWRATNRLTLNLGIRYDLNLVPQDVNRVSRTLRFDLDPSGPILWPEPGQKVQLFLREHKNIAPRFGFAYRLRDRLVVRGGYGIFTMAAHFDQTNILQINPPNASILLTNTNLNPVATIQSPFPPALLPANPIFNVVSTEVDRYHQDGYYQNWNFSVGYELTKDDILEVRYVGSKGTHLDTSQLNFNSPDPDPTAGGVIQSRRPYPQFGRIRMWDDDGNSNYHSMQTKFERRFSQGLSFTAAHTWSHLIDDQMGGLNGARSLAQDRVNNRSNMRADSADDLRHVLVFGYVWQMPFARSRTGVAGALLSGWQLGGITTFRTGSTVNVTQDGDALNTDPQGDIRPNVVPGVKPYLPNSGRSLARWFNTAAFQRATLTYGTSPRNPLRGPGIKTFDLSMMKSFRVREGQRLEFRWEAFNAFNTPQFSNPNGTLGNTNFGVIQGTRINNREMQVALKYMF